MMRNISVGFLYGSLCGFLGAIIALCLSYLFKFKIGGWIYWLIEIFVTFFLVFIYNVYIMI